MGSRPPRRDLGGLRSQAAGTRQGTQGVDERAVRDFDSATEVGRFRELASTWRHLPDPDADLVSGARVQRLLATESDLRRQGRWTTGPSSLLEVLGVEGDEVRNCRVARWLLDPLARHGLGPRILRSVLDDLVRLGATEETGAPFPDHADAIVEVEVTRGDTRADIVIYGPSQSWTVVFEAKVWAGEGQNQGAALARQWPKATLVFLTRTGQAMKSAGESVWLPYRWEHLLDHTAAATRRSTSTGDRRQEAARSAVTDYLEGTRGLRP